MLGPSVLIIPILVENYTDPTIRAYLPLGWWYQHYYDNILDSLGEESDVRVPEEFHSIPILYQGGTILVKQEPGQTTTERYAYIFQAIHILA
jgi:alpha-glucosidase (family GH31 glycosyl hydrolase)